MFVSTTSSSSSSTTTTISDETSSRQEERSLMENNTPLEKEPLIDEHPTTADDRPQTFWKGCEFLKSSNLCSSKLSLSSASSNMCRICHSSTSTRTNPLISPCRCSGTLLHVHKGCVVRWLEMSTRKMVPSPKCELCGYDYRRANILQIRSIHVPHVDRYSCILNLFFVLTVIIMTITCYLTISFLQQNAILKRRPTPISSAQATYTWKRRGYFNSGPNGEMEHTDGPYHTPRISGSIFDTKVILCMSLFVLALLVALFTQYRAECTLFRCIFRFFVINKNWMIKDYDIRYDPEMALRRDTQQHQQTQDPVLLSPSQICQNSNFS